MLKRFLLASDCVGRRRRPGCASAESTPRRGRFHHQRRKFVCSKSTPAMNYIGGQPCLFLVESSDRRPSHEAPNAAGRLLSVRAAGAAVIREIRKVSSELPGRVTCVGRGSGHHSIAWTDGSPRVVCYFIAALGHPPAVPNAPTTAILFPD